MNNLKSILAIAFSLITWASAFTVIKVVVDQHQFAVVHLVFWRLIFAAIFLFIVGIIYGIKIPKLKDFPLILATAICGIVFYNLALCYAEIQISSGAASFIGATSPIWCVMIAILFLKDKINFGILVGIIISILGIYIISIFENASGKLELTMNKYTVLMIAAAVGSGAYTVFHKLLLKKYTPLESNVYIWCGGAILILFFWKGAGEALIQAPKTIILSILYLSIVPAALAYWAWSYALSKLSIVTATSTVYLIPVITIIISLIFINEPIKIMMIVGGIIAVFGVAILNISKLKAVKKE